MVFDTPLMVSLQGLVRLVRLDAQNYHVRFIETFTMADQNLTAGFPTEKPVGKVLFFGFPTEKGLFFRRFKQVQISDNFFPMVLADSDFQHNKFMSLQQQPTSDRSQNHVPALRR